LKYNYNKIQLKKENIYIQTTTNKLLGFLLDTISLLVRNGLING